ncbi:hypothetical protein DS884_04055 [Tenacibaculum sp. E3R01]|uniref:hypothetical protein n=1 Tax=Tenacibaculum sp. E3R01 TaxID=2267227 RepID=UPI000DE86612|nr:hypothetical protein [Tenacibaculum sp. E3R01]RBW60759.1 hypothetical protein DS884_04055 [Tenacibaculum sp. E3R01]
MKRLIILIAVISNLSAFAQKEIGNSKPAVKVMATATKKAIMLRWGVTTPTAWKYANKYGFIIERKTIVRDKKVVNQPETITITTVPLKPKPMMQWKEFTKKNTNAAIAAQALYGDQFEVNMNEGGNGVLSILNQAQAFEQRFVFALYAADQDFEVAKFSGLGFVDITVKENERYLYTVKVALPKEKKYQIKSGGAYIGLIDYKPLPKPLEFVGVFKDKTAMLSWNYSILKKYYTNYIIEKSDNNGLTFKPITNTPVANFGEREIKPSNRMMYVDSLFQNNKGYKYRIKGISPFGIQGPYSNVVQGKGVSPLLHNPFITKSKLLANGSALLEWEFPFEGLSTLKSFQIKRANKAKGNYVLINESISKNNRSIIIDNLQAVNYYKIIAVGTDGSKRESFPKMIQTDDSIPPAVPGFIQGTIDSLGVVRLNWKQNAEIDFLGYRVFRANLKNDEFIQRTFEPIYKSNFIDSINIKTLNKYVYYKIQAFDKRYNPSQYSEVLKLKRPDIIPPTQPVFSSFKVIKGNVELTWITSSSKDAISTMLYRKEKGVNESWQLLDEFPIPVNKYVDKTGKEGKIYLYTLLTLDDSGLESKPITPLKVKVTNNASKPLIQKFVGNVNREEKFIELSWNYKEKKLNEFILYKAEKGKQPTMYRVFNASKNTFKDTNLIINTKYTYLLQAVFMSGAKSPLKKIELNY